MMTRVFVILCVTLALTFAILVLRQCYLPLLTLDRDTRTSNDGSLKKATRAENTLTIPKGNGMAGSNPQSITSLLATPIKFYGKVQNQDGLPIEGAEIRFSVADKFGGGSSKQMTQSDANGSFVISSKGIALSVFVSKNEYFSIPWKEGNTHPFSRGTFDYGADFGKGVHKPNQDEPVIFTLIKPPAIEPLNRIREKETMMPRSGESVKVTLDVPTHVLELKCWTNDVNKERDGRYDWKLEVAVVDGGIQRRSDNYDFIAPSDGYSQTDRIQMPRTLERPDWRDDYEQSYWVRFNDGLFGNIKVRMIAGGAHYSIVSGYINPKPGSRNLATNPSKRK